MTAIDLIVLTRGEVRSLSGHDRGIAARTLFKLDQLDLEDEQVTVIAPENLDALTPSFVQGLFANSVRRLGRDKFYSHYRFDLPKYLMTDVELGIDRVLMPRTIAGT